MSRPERPPFPVDKTGDVNITITPERTYQLSSTRIKEGIEGASILELDEQHAVTLCNLARGNSVTVRFHLVLGTQVDSDRPELYATALTDWGVPYDVDQYGRLLVLNASGTLDGRVTPYDPKRDLGTRSNALVEAWHIVLALITGNSAQLPDLRAAFPREAYGVFRATAVHMADIAKALGCYDKVIKRLQEEIFIDLPVLSNEISQDPALWLDLAHHMRNEWLWKEAIVHAVGHYNDTSVQSAIDEGRMNGFDASLIANATQKLKGEVKKELTYLMNELGDTERATHTHEHGGRNIELAIRVFRGYIHGKMQESGADDPWEWDDLGFGCVKLFYNQKYLDDGEINLLIEETGYSHEPFKTDIFTIVKNFKVQARQQVKHLMKNETKYSVKEKVKKHFTCTIIDAADVPKGYK